MASQTASLINTQTIEQLSPGLFRSALRMVQRREDAEDLVQETWFSALQSVSTFQGRSSLRTWLTGILRRRVADRYRRERATDSFDEESCYPSWVPDNEQLDVSTVAARATHALSQLSGPERTAITLCDIDDLDRDEAAAHMRITRGHLRVLLHRARRGLEVSLRAQGLDTASYC